MDGIHDLGGMQGFGRIDVDEPEVQFHHPYEARMRCIAHTITQAPDWSKDWFRHCRELIDPGEYLTRPYFDNWAQGYCAMLVNSGWASVNELATGTMTDPVAGLPPPIDAAAARAAVLKAIRFDAEPDTPPRFRPGDKVHTTTDVTNGHTRLPQYARGRTGTVITHHGAHIFPDDMAINIKRYHHLYTVEFDMRDLWPEAVDSNDTVTLDLWEPYFES